MSSSWQCTGSIEANVRGSGSVARRVVRLMAASLVAVPIAGAAQTVTVSGRVLDATTAARITGAAVSVAGRSTATQRDGSFILSSIQPGIHILTVHAFGYDTTRTELLVERDTVLEIRLTPVPVRLDSIRGVARTVVLRGLVRETGSHRHLRNVSVLADGGRSAHSDRLGRFRLELPQGAPVAVRLLSFSYLPLRVLLELDSDTTVTFELSPDPVVHEMIARAVERLDRRATPLRTVGMPALDRELLLRSNSNLYQLLETKGYTARIRCVLVDDIQYLGEERAGRLRAMLPDDVERVELLYRGEMLRVYTREFIRRMVVGQVQLQPPVYVRVADPPYCR